MVWPSLTRGDPAFDPNCGIARHNHNNQSNEKTSIFGSGGQECQAILSIVN
jgi:hypothetical protein